MAFRYFISLIPLKEIKSLFYNYFGFNKQQRKGLLTLCFICLALTVIRLAYPYFIDQEPIVIKNLPLIERKLDSAQQSNSYFKKKNYTENISGKLFVFDPNTISFNDLLSLGFKEKTAKVFLKFRTKGFVFKRKGDLKKVFGISDNFYEKLEPYIVIKNLHNEENKKIISEPKAETFIKAEPARANKNVEINGADSLTLLEINGIGPSFVKRILKYRSLLGGFTNTEQLKEVYGFTEELYNKIKLNISVNVALIKKINLSKDDFKVINKHPYITYELAKNIFDWRRKTNITKDNIAAILNDDVLYRKLIPYLEF